MPLGSFRKEQTLLKVSASITHARKNKKNLRFLLFFSQLFESLRLVPRKYFRSEEQKKSTFSFVLLSLIRIFANMKLYHGTNTIVKKPEIRIIGYTKDFGYGFYCTEIERQARRWAIAKRNPHIVCTYEYTPDPELNIKRFMEMTDEWLDFVAACRHGESHPYDIVEGPMADDEVWDYVEDFLAGRITREAFWELAKFKHPTHQILFCNDKALASLQYVDYYEIKDQL